MSAKNIETQVNPSSSQTVRLVQRVAKHALLLWPWDKWPVRTHSTTMDAGGWTFAILRFLERV